MRGTLTVAVALVLLASGPVLLTAHGQTSGSSGKTLLITDPLGDVGPLGVGVDGNPAMTAYQHIDIVELEVGPDDPDNLYFRIGVAGFDPVVTAPAQAISLNDMRCRIEWTYDGPSGVEYLYTLSINSGNQLRTPGGAPESSYTIMYFDYDGPDGREWAYGWDLPVEIVFDTETSSIFATVPKPLAPVWPGGQVAQRGDDLIIIGAECAADLGSLGGAIQDDIVPGDARYAVQADGPGQLVHIRFADQGGAEGEQDAGSWEFPTHIETAPVATAAPGTATVLPLVLENTADGRKLVQLGVSGAPDGWNLTVAPSVFLAAGETRTVNLIVTAPTDAAIGDTHRIDVTAQAVGESDRGVAGRLLKVMPRLSPEHDTFYLHLERRTYDDAVNTAFGTTIPTYDVAASLLQSLDGYTNTPAEIHPLTYWGGGNGLDPLVRPVRLDAEVPVAAQVALNGDAGRMVRIEMSLSSDETGTIFAIDKEVPGNGIAKLEALLPGEGIITLPAGIRPYFNLRVGPSGFDAGATGEVTLDPTQSWFRLPVVDDGQDVVFTDGRYLPSLALASEEDATTYLNPGKEYAFELVLANEGVETDDLRVVVEGENATGWDISVLPGSLFRVSPGNSTPVSVVVRAPADAAEGAHPTFEVIAQSKNDAVARTTITLDAIVTSGVDIDSKGYKAKDNELAPLSEDVEESPTAAGGLLVIALIGLVAAIRRKTA